MTPITRDVVTDLWPIYESGEASADTRAVVEEFLAGDPQFAATLRSRPVLEGPVNLTPDLEVTALKRTRDLVKGNAWLRGLRLVALALTALAIAHLLRNGEWNEAIRMFVIELGGAAVAWTTYAVLLGRYRQRALRA
jgi:hypothetical protein